MNQALWTPDPQRLAQTRWQSFVKYLLQQGHHPGDDLHAWSLEHREEFWSSLVAFLDVNMSPWTSVLTHDHMPGARWFEGAQFNFAEQLLRHEGIALIAHDETGHRRELDFSTLRQQVARLAGWMRQQGIVAGDRVAAVLPNGPEAVVSMLASATLGAIYSSCSPDFGLQGLLDRFGQIQPRLLIACNHYFYAGKRQETRPKILNLQAALPSVKNVLFCNRDLYPTHSVLEWEDLPQGSEPLTYTALPFASPLYILYSSGTTGVPKCIVHGAGGTLLQHFKELALHTDVHAGDRVFYFTTCGWMMWNWLVSCLGLGATAVLYDGSPFQPETCLWDIADQEQLTHLGTSAKYLSQAEKMGLQPRTTHHLAHLRTLMSTGSPLAHESFDYVYRDIKEDIALTSISGGTDIISCFALGNPIRPVYRGELQSKGLGMAVEIRDEQGQRLGIGQKGELCCVKAFPSMPLGFWGDEEGRRYHAAYFEKFPGLWAHGDYAEETEHGGIIIHGRSDAVLNPGGVRIGTAEIYRQVERLPEILESLAVGQRCDQDERIVLFVRLAEHSTWTHELQAKLRQTIREGATPRHVPAVFVVVTDLPRTRSGKIAELAVRQVIHGQPVNNVEALANPECLQQFRDRPELQN